MVVTTIICTYVYVYLYKPHHHQSWLRSYQCPTTYMQGIQTLFVGLLDYLAFIKADET